MTGDTPFPEPLDTSDEASPGERYPQLVEPPIPPDGRLSPDLAEPVMAGLAKDPEDRPTASELALAFQPAVAALPGKLRLGRRGPI